MEQQFLYIDLFQKPAPFPIYLTNLSSSPENRLEVIVGCVNALDNGLSYAGWNEKPRISFMAISTCSPVERFFILQLLFFISSSPMIMIKGIFFFSAYLNCLSNFAVS